MTAVVKFARAGRETDLAGAARRAARVTAVALSGRRVRRPRPCVPGDRAGAGAGRARQRGHGRDLGALARGGRGRSGLAFTAARGVQDVPPAPAGLGRRPVGGRRGAGAGAADGGGAVRRRGQRHPDARAGARGRAGGAAAGDPDPARLPGARGGAAVLRVRRAAAADAGRAGAVARGAAGAGRAGWSAGATSSTSRAPVVGPGADRAARTAGSRRSWRWWRRFRSSSIRGAGRRACGWPGRWRSSCRIPMSSCRRATGRWSWSRRRRRRTRSAGWCGSALEALADEPVRVLATTNRHLPAEPLPPAPANAVVVDWLSYTQAMAAADLVICHGGHGTVARALGAGVPVLVLSGGRRHGRERGAGRVVGRRADAAVAVAGPGVAAAGGAAGCSASRAFAARAGEIAAWAAGHDGADAGRRAGRGAGAGLTRARFAPGSSRGGLEPTTSRLTAECICH